MFTEIGTRLGAIGHNIGDLVSNLVVLLSLLAANLALWLIWVAVWLFAANWKHLWPTLGRGGWAVVGLLGVVAAFVWSQIDPSGCESCGLSAFWRRLGEVGLLFAVALVCGHLQGVIRCGPPELTFDPPPPEHPHAGHDLTGHSHAHAHH